MTDPTGAGDSAEIARLRAERDALRAEVERLSVRARRRGWWRQPTAAALVALACVVLVAAVVGVWARRNFLDTDAFVDRVGPLIDRPAVQDALASRLTEELMVLVDPVVVFEEVLPEQGRILAVPLGGAVEGFVRDQVESFVASDAFRSLWFAAVEVAHGTAVDVLRGESEVVTAEGGRVTLNLLPVIDGVLTLIVGESPEILGREVELPDLTIEEVPATAIAAVERALGVELDEDFGQITVYDEGELTAAQDAVALLEGLAVVLLPLGVALAGLALWVSARRRRTLLQLAAGLALGMVLVRRVAFQLQDEVAALPPEPAGRRSAGLAAEAFLEPLTAFAWWVLAGTAVVAAVAVLTADYPWVVPLRRRGAAGWALARAAVDERARDEATVAWIRDHRDVLLAAGVIAALVVLWVADLSWIGVLVVLGLVAAFELGVLRVGAPPAGPVPPAGAEAAGDGTP